MTDNDARIALEKLASKYLKETSDFNDVMQIIRDKNRPGLPVRGTLEKIGPHLAQGFSGDEQVLIAELIYLYG